jgi:hypothetical protein
MTELRIQQECYVFFHNTYPQYRGLFFRIKNEGHNRISGAIGKATGIIPGVSDSCLLLPGHPATFIEFKTEKGKQSDVQIAWQYIVEHAGFSYFIIRNLKEFKDLLCLLGL